MKKKFILSFRGIFNRKQSIINSLRRELDKQVRAQNALSEKYHHLDKSTSILMNFKTKRDVPLLK